MARSKRKEVTLTQAELMPGNTLPIVKLANGFTKQITQLDIDKIQELCSIGAKAEYVAYSLGMRLRDLESLRLDFPQIDDAINNGCAMDEFEVSNSLREQATNGNVLACIYYTKARHGWREKDTPNQNNLTIIQVTTGITRQD
jgi:hypothetical protein